MILTALGVAAQYVSKSVEGHKEKNNGGFGTKIEEKNYYLSLHMSPRYYDQE